MSNITPDAATKQEVRQLLKRLARLKRKWPSEPALRDLSPQMVEALHKHIRVQSKWNLYLRLLTAWLLLLLAFSDSIHLPHTIVVITFFGLAGSVLAWFIHDSKRRLPIYALTQTDDLRVLPTLIIVTSDYWKRHPQTIQAIRRLLPQVTEEHAGQFSSRVQARIWHFAMPAKPETYHDEALIFEALRALCYVGDYEILNRMRDATQNPDPSPRVQRISQHIQQLIPVMEARLKRQEVPATLLRASDTPIAHSETLLRPAHTATAEPAEQLLRAGTGEQD